MTHSSQTAPQRALDSAHGSAAEAVFETLLRDIVSGAYAPGARLPAERELARALGASRPTLREALRCLADWRLVETRRGSGIVVRPQSEWSIEVLPAFLRHARLGASQPTRAALVADLLVLRRSMVREIIALSCGRISAAGVAQVRTVLAQAWAARSEPARFLVEDLAAMRTIAEAAGLWPALWLLNRLAEVYLVVARSVASVAEPPHDYLEVHERMLAALEQGDRQAATASLDDYLERADRGLLELVA